MASVRKNVCNKHRKCSATPRIYLYAEFKANLSVVQLIVRYEKDSRSQSCCSDVLTLTSSSLECKTPLWPPGSSDAAATAAVTTFHFQRLTLLPRSCHGLKLLHDEVHFRLRVSGETRTLAHRTVLPPSAVEKKLMSPFAVDGFTCRCRMCGQTIIRPCRFRRVLPLPSDNWFDASNSWFCHQHTPLPTDAVSMAPRRGDCLVAESNFMVAAAMLDSGAVAGGGADSNAALKCKRCRHLIGRYHNMDGRKMESGVVENGGVRLFVHSLELGGQLAGQDTAQHASPGPEVAQRRTKMADLLLSQSAQYNSFRFVIETRTSANKPYPYILVMVIESNVQLYVTESGRDDGDVSLQPLPVVKILYVDCLRAQHKSLASDWDKDLTVHGLELPQEVCAELLQQLINSTWTVPQSLRKLDGFYLGYLERGEDDDS